MQIDTMDADVRYEVRERSARITMNLPERANALTMAGLARLEECFEQAADDRQVRVRVFQGAGGRGLRLGFPNRVVDSAALQAATQDLADVIAGNAPPTVRRVKQVAAKGRELPLPTALRQSVGPETCRSEHVLQGARAFVERRAPLFRSRWRALFSPLLGRCRA